MESNEYGEMRKVEFTGVWRRNVPAPMRGRFHRWGVRLNYIHGSSNPSGAAEVVAIVETEDGCVHEVPVDKLKFLDRLT